MTTTVRQEKIQLAARRCGITVTKELDGAVVGYKSEWGPQYAAIVILTGRMRKPAIFAAFGLPLDCYLRRYSIAA